jgi:hypothetical protein
VALEIKSAQTVAEDFFAPLRLAADRLAVSDGCLAGSFLVGVGDGEQRRRNCTVVPWAAVGTVPAW